MAAPSEAGRISVARRTVWRASLGDTIADGWRVLSAEDSGSGQKDMYEACCTVLSRDVLQRRAA